jgi:hypothetical protein
MTSDGRSEMDVTLEGVVCFDVGETKARELDFSWIMPVILIGKSSDCTKARTDVESGERSALDDEASSYIATDLYKSN